ncbi:NADPH-dependent 2,4-dienoyl-CoA reductase, sulfur reductase [Clostridium collagenovorans DSM 3089]|uniref:NADPH-dependent 2,4-dienoyl-CoA reductase, sulfur reductase n=1 Tax=Clostridium collagenovorans DSM 3089 TaxID=1121306 RepID=A0A1M5VG22_9CLOT|nr:FAD-dependent oxidoreductase [Clostridium collagenovorans]SHH73873.1 NADPH-dependent 2,4-dienoyl-CoA reductase, sulfur reductase [Clostridium collagenovorans DSM 3089]
MSRKVLIVGGVAGGASAAARLRRLSEEDRIIMFEKGPHVSFSNCSLPYHLSGTVDKVEKLVLMNPQKFMKQYKIEARVNNEVIKIDRENKEVHVKDVLTNEIYKESYDKLILSPGAKPVVPRIEGIENVNIFTIRNVVDIDKLNKFITDMPSKRVTVIGGGFIGVEVAENLKKASFEVTLIEAMPQILRTFDYDMVQIFHKELMDQGVNLIVGDKVKSFEKDKVVLESGKTVEAQAVVMAIGISPETSLAKEAGLELGETGAIKTDQNYKTTDEDIYAVGDAIEVYNSLTLDMTKLSLAGPAQREARAVADHINGISVNNTGFIGSSAIKVFDYNGASTGLNEGLIKALNMKIDYEVVSLVSNDKVGLMPDNSPVYFKLLFEKPTGRILGAQAIGKGNVVKRIDVIATAMAFGGTVENLKNLELCYAPPFGTAKDVVNFAGYIGCNLLRGDFKQVKVDQIRELLEENALIIDVREKFEYENGHIKGVNNIPLSEFRERINEIPKDKPVYLHCRSGQRSYNAALILKSLGYDKVYNVTGSYNALSFYEYYNDKTTGRKSILTEYNFK